MRLSFRVVVAIFCLCLLTPAVVLACLWDHDTLQMERQRFPSTLELIAGKFLRHTPEFYQWRIQDRLRKLQLEPDNLAYLDDLAVAYDKTDRHDKAIETMLSARAKKAGRYETEANLGTFYIHDGQLEKGLSHIDVALRINPDAHFGREKYQKALVEYVLSRRKLGGPSLPLRREGEGFATHLFPRIREGKPVDVPEIQAALKGILGMMRFGYHDSPILLEALGDALLSPSPRGDNSKDAKRLAARAYLKASYEVQDEATRAVYRGYANEALLGQKDASLEGLEKEFRGELEEAREWYARLRQNELTWLRDGLDPEKMFAQTYYREPEYPWQPEPEAGQEELSFFLTWFTVSLVILGGGCLAVLGYRRWCRLAHGSPA